MSPEHALLTYHAFMWVCPYLLSFILHIHDKGFSQVNYFYLSLLVLKEITEFIIFWSLTCFNNALLSYQFI